MSDAPIQPNSSVDLPAALPLRSDLIVHRATADNIRGVLEDSSKNVFYRLGRPEQSFVQHLLHGETPEVAWQSVQTEQDACQAAPWSREAARTLCHWLCQNRLTAETPASPQPAAVSAGLPQRCLALTGKFYFWKASLVDPDRFLNRLVDRARWLFQLQTMLCGLAVLLLGVLFMLGHWSEFFACYENLLTPWRGLWIALAWLGLKCVHETAHAGTCKLYGGSVRDAGIAMILLMPIAYVDVSSSWRFPSRWQRLHVTLAGVAVELFVAGLSLLAWHCFDALPLKQAAADLFLLASVSSLLFNLNPLLKFDGYFALADLSGVDNLYSYGQSYARYWGSRYLLGLNASQPSLPKSSRRFIKIYGLAAACYRTLTVSGMLITAAALFHGAGIVIAAAGAISFGLLPLSRLGQHLWELYRDGELYATRLALRLTGILTLAALVLLVVPADLRRTAPAVVQYDPPAIVRAPLAGFVDQIHVSDGQHVEAGQPIVTLRNDELQNQLAALQKELLQIEQEVRAARWNSDVSLLGDAQSRRIGIREQLAQKQQQFDSRIVRAASPGRIVARQLATRIGCYVQQGEELGAIGFEQKKRLKVSLSQHDANLTGNHSNAAVTVIIAHQSSWRRTLTQTESRASESVPDDALIASYGGCLSVIKSDDDQLRLCEPRINAYVSLSEEQSIRVRCGQRAFVRLPGRRKTWGLVIWDHVNYWTDTIAWHSRATVTTSQ